MDDEIGVPLAGHGTSGSKPRVRFKRVSRRNKLRVVKERYQIRLERRESRKRRAARMEAAKVAVKRPLVCQRCGGHGRVPVARPLAVLEFNEVVDRTGLDPAEVSRIFGDAYDRKGRKKKRPPWGRKTMQKLVHMSQTLGVEVEEIIELCLSD